MIGKHSQRLDYLRKKIQSENSKTNQDDAPQQENAPNSMTRALSPPNEALPPTKYSTLFRQRMKADKRKNILSNQQQKPNPKESSGKKFALSTPATVEQEEKEVIFSDASPATMMDNDDANVSAWAMLGDSDDFKYKDSEEMDGSIMALLETSLISLSESSDVVAALPPKTPSRSSNSNGANTPHVCFEEWQHGSPNRLVGSSRAKKKEIQSVEPPGKGSPFNTFRQNSTGIALDETNLYVARIKELEAALKAEKEQRIALETNPKNAFQTPAPSRGTITSTPGTISSTARDPEALYSRNQTLVKEVRFAEQTCIELSGEKNALEKKTADLQAQLASLRQENQTLQNRVSGLEREKATAESLETSWKSRVSEVESLLGVAETEKSKAQQKCRDWENRCIEIERKAAEQSQADDDRKGKLMQAILDKERLNKDLQDALEKYQSAKKHAESLEKMNSDLSSRFEETEQEVNSQKARQAKMQAELDTLRATNVRMQYEQEQAESRKQADSEHIRRLMTENEQITEKGIEKESHLQTLLSKAREENVRLQEEVSKARITNKRLMEESTESAQKELQRCSSRIHELERMLREKDVDLQSRTNEIENLNSQLSNTKMGLEEAAYRLETERAKNASEVSGLLSEAEYLRQKIKDLETKNAVAKNDVERLDRERAVESQRHEEQWKQYKRDLDGLTREREEWESKCGNLQETFRKTEADLSNRNKIYRVHLGILEATARSREEKVSVLSQRLEGAEARFRQVVEERANLLKFKECAINALQKFPGLIEDSCTRIEDLFNDQTSGLCERVEVLAHLASTLRANIVFEQDWKDLGDTALPNQSSHSLEFSSHHGPDSSHLQSPTALQDWEGLEEPENFQNSSRRSLNDAYLPHVVPPFGPTSPPSYQGPPNSNETHALSSPVGNRTLELEWMEEARCTETNVCDESSNGPTLGHVEVRGSDADSRVSETLSSIAGLSHLFPEENQAVTQVNNDEVSTRVGQSSTENNNAEHQEQVDDLSNQLRTLRARLRDAELERDLMRESIEGMPGREDHDRLKILLEEANIDRVKLEEEIETLRQLSDATKADLEDSLASKEQTIQAQKEQFQEKIRDLEIETQTKVERLKAEIERLETDLDVSQKKVERFTELHRLAEAENVELKNSLRDLRFSLENRDSEDTQALENALEDLEQKTSLLDAAINEREDLRKQFDAFRQAAEAQKNELNWELNRCKKELVHKTIEVDTLIKSHESQIVERDSTLDKTKSDLSAIKMSFEQTSKEIADLSLQKNMLEVQCSEKDRQIESIRKEHRTICEQLRESRQELNALSMRHAKTEEGLPALVKENNQLSLKIDVLSKDKMQLEEELNIARERLAYLDKVVADLRHEKKELANALQENMRSTRDIEAEVESTRVRLAKVNAECATLRSNGRSQRQEREDIETELKIKLEAEQERQERDAARMSELISANSDLTRRIHGLEGEIQMIKDELEKKNVALENAEKRVGSLLESVSSLEIERGGLKERIKSLSQENEKLQTCFLDCNEKLEGISLELQNIQRQLEATEQERDAAEELAKDTENRLMELQRARAHLAQENEAIGKQLLEKKEAIVLLEKQSSSASEEAAKLGEAVESLRLEIKNLNSEMTNLSSAKDALESEKATLLAERKSDHMALDLAEGTIADYKKELHDLKSRLSQIAGEQQEKDQLIASLRKDVEASEGLARDTEDRYLEMQSTLSSLKNDRESLQREVETRLQALSDMKENLQHQNRDLDTARGERDDALQVAETLGQELAAARSTIKESETRITLARNEIGTLVSQRDSLKVELSELRDVRSNLEKMERLCQEHQNDVSAYRERLAEAEGRAKECAENQNRLQQELQVVVKEKEGLHAQFEELQKSFKKHEVGAKMEMSDLQDRLLRTQELLESANGTEEELAKVSEKLKAAESSLVAMSELQSDLDAVRASLEDRDDTIALLEKELSESNDHCANLTDQLSEIQVCIAERDEQLAHQEEAINILKKKCKGLRNYVRKVAGKCDNWEVYYEKQSGVVESLKRKTQRIVRAFKEQQLQGGLAEGETTGILGDLDEVHQELANVRIPLRR